MVLLAASIVTRGGRAVVSRQFVDMTRARIEGLLAAFPKLIPKDGGQHTFVETDTVRYVYESVQKNRHLFVSRSSKIVGPIDNIKRDKTECVAESEVTGVKKYTEIKVYFFVNL